MTKKKTTAYWLLLIGILLLVSLALLIRPTRSHYINTTVWNTAMYPEGEISPTSDCLVAGGQTILLGKLPLTNEAGEVLTSSYPFTLSEAGGTLNCSVDEGTEYLSAAVTPTETGGVLTLTPILTTAHTGGEAKITVTWTTAGEDILWGTFLVTIPEVKEEIVTPPENDSSGGDNSEGNENDPGGTTTDPDAGTSDDDTQQQTEDTTQDTPTVTPTVGAVNLTIDAPKTYDVTGLLPVHLEVEGEFNAIYLGIPRSGEDGAVLMGELPHLTRYSLDGGETYTLLYGGGLVELESSGTVLLDLRQTGLTESQTVYVQVYNSETLVQEKTFETAAGQLLPRESTGGARVVTADKNSKVEIPLPDQGESAKLTWTVSVRGGYGVYTAIEDPADIGLTVALLTDEAKGSYIQITTQNENGLTPAPGTYKLQLDWSWQGTPFAGTELTFFVNYVVDAQA